MAPEHTINFRAEDDAEPLTSALASTLSPSDRERCLRQPNATQPINHANTVDKEQRAKKSKKPKKQFRGGTPFDRHHSHKPQQRNVLRHEQDISPTTVLPKNSPYQPEIGYTEHHLSATAPLTRAIPTMSAAAIASEQPRRATADPWFAPINYNPAGSSQTSSQVNTAHSHRTHLPNHDREYHTVSSDKMSFNNMPELIKDDGCIGGLGSTANMRNHYPGVPMTSVVPPPNPIRPIDNLHSLLDAFNTELDRLMSAVKQPTNFPDAHVNASKQDILTRLAIEIIPSLGVTSTRVGSAIRDGMYFNDGGIALYAGSHTSFAAQHGPHMAPAQTNYYTEAPVEPSLPMGHFPPGWPQGSRYVTTPIPPDNFDGSTGGTESDSHPRIPTGPQFQNANRGTEDAVTQHQPYATSYRHHNRRGHGRLYSHAQR